MVTQVHKLIIVIVLLLYSFNVNAQNFIVDGINYNVVTQDRTCEVIANPTAPYAGDVKIPDVVTNNGKTLSVIAIGSKAFNGCTGLTSITIPSGVTSIGEKAFAGCNALKEVISWNKVAPTITADAFESIDYKNAILKVPAGSWNTYRMADGWKEFMNLKDYLYKDCFVVDGIYYNIIEPDKSCEVIESQTTPYAGNVIIPDVVTNNGKTLSVIAIGYKAFNECHDLTSITIPSGVTSIGESAFFSCSKLTSIPLPSGLTSIGKEAFCACYDLTSISIPNSVTSIGIQAFGFCESLTSIEIPSGVTSISGHLFRRCESLTSIILPSGVTSIGDWAFSSCESLESIEIPSGVTSIGDYAFSDCDYLWSIEIPSMVTSIGDYAFSGCRYLGSIEIPSKVTSIGDYAFAGCGLGKVITRNEVPPTTTKSAFDTSVYKKVTLIVPEGSLDAYKLAEGWKEFFGIKEFVVDGIYYNIIEPDKTCEVIANPTTPYSGDIIIPSTVPYQGKWFSVIAIGEKAFNECHELTSITIPSGVTSINNNAFQSCDKLTSVEIPSGVTSIGGGAFNGCYELTSISIPNSVTSIGYQAFGHCNNLTSIEIPSGVTSISGSLFMNCQSLTAMILPSGVTSIEYGAFAGCNGLESIEMPSGLTSIGDHAFEACNSLESIEIPSGVTSIGGNAFAGCSGLSKVITRNEVPPTTTKSAFDTSVYEKTTLIVPEGSLDAYKLAEGWKEFLDIKDDSGVTGFVVDGIYYNIIEPDKTCEVIANPTTPYSGDIIIPNTVPYQGKWFSVIAIGEKAFDGCNELSSIEISSSAISIGNRAFSNCSGLTSIEIPISVTSIGEYAFYGCSGLTSITIPSGVTSISESAFNRCSGLTSIEIPNSVTSISKYAFSNCSSFTSIIIPSSITSIGEGSFFGCTGLTSIILPSGITSISASLFNGCWGLESIEIPSGVTSIGNYAFSNCIAITSITLPSGVTSIGEKAFMSCNALREVMTLNSVPPTCGDSFDIVAYENATLRVPVGSLDAYKLAEGWKEFMNIKDDLSGVEDATANEPKISIIGEVIIIEGVDDDANVDVYNVAGMLVYSGVSKTISTPATGIYILKIAGRSYKIAVK